MRVQAMVRLLESDRPISGRLRGTECGAHAVHGAGLVQWALACPPRTSRGAGFPPHDAEG